jgi:putative colanic acid biosynthesis acetyltransferase WcaF
MKSHNSNELNDKSDPTPIYQDLSLFTVPLTFRGRPAWIVQLWWFVDATMFQPSPQIFYGWRRMLLRLFGAHVGKNVLIRSSARITYPWKVSIGDYSWIGDDVTLYSLGLIEIGKNSVISQRSYICAGDHNYSSRDFPIRANGIKISDEVWVATDVFVGPGATIGRAAVVGARSTVLNNIPEATVCIGTPARVIKQRLPTNTRLENN